MTGHGFAHPQIWTQANQGHAVLQASHTHTSGNRHSFAHPAQDSLSGRCFAHPQICGSGAGASHTLCEAVRFDPRASHTQNCLQIWFASHTQEYVVGHASHTHNIFRKELRTPSILKSKTLLRTPSSTGGGMSFAHPQICTQVVHLPDPVLLRTPSIPHMCPCFAHPQISTFPKMGLRFAHPQICTQVSDRLASHTQDRARTSGFAHPKPIVISALRTPKSASNGSRSISFAHPQMIHQR